MTLWYFSFATDEAFLGCTVAEGDTAEVALAAATAAGLNPGGEVMILAVPPSAESAPDMIAMRGRLVGRDEAVALGGRRLADLPPSRRPDEAGLVCAEHNNQTRRDTT